MSTLTVVTGKANFSSKANITEEIVSTTGLISYVSVDGGSIL